MQRRRNRLAIGVLSVMLSMAAVPAAAQGLPTAEAVTVYGQPDLTSTGYSGSPTGMGSPNGIALDEASDTLYVVDASNNRILRWQNASTRGNGEAAEVLLSACPGALSGVLAANCISSASSVRVDDRGGLWIADGTRLIYFPSAATMAADSSATIVLGAADFVTLGVRGYSSVFFADGQLHAIADGALASWPYSTLPASGTLPTDQLDAEISFFSTGVADPVNGGFWLSLSTGRIDYIPDSTDITVRTGELGRSVSDDQPAPSQTLPVGPAGLALDEQGTLYVADFSGGRVLGFLNAYERGQQRKQGGAAVAADLLFGDTDWTADTVGATAANLVKPLDVAYDDVTKRLYVSDNTANRVVAIPFEMSPAQDDVLAAPLRDCDVTPDLAMSPERIELAAGGTATLEIAMRNVGTTPHGYNDIVLSLSDGLRVVEAPGMRNLGQRAAVQIDEVGPNETIRLNVTVAADTALAVTPQFVVEQYCGGRVLQRIDGVFVGATTVAAPPAAEAPAEAPAPVDVPLPAVLPNTAGTAVEGQTGLPAVLLLVLAGALLLRGRTRQR